MRIVDASRLGTFAYRLRAVDILALILWAYFRLLTSRSRLLSTFAEAASRSTAVATPIQAFGTRRHQAAGAAQSGCTVFHGHGRLRRAAQSCLQQGRQPADLRQCRVPMDQSLIERDWRAIRVELDRVLTRKDELPGFHELAADVASISQDRGWKTFVLAGYGFRSGNNIKVCPRTWAACQELSRTDHGDVLDSRSRACICRRIAAPITACCGCITGSSCQSRASNWASASTKVSTAGRKAKR